MTDGRSCSKDIFMLNQYQRRAASIRTAQQRLSSLLIHHPGPFVLILIPAAAVILHIIRPKNILQGLTRLAVCDGRRKHVAQTKLVGAADICLVPPVKEGDIDPLFQLREDGDWGLLLRACVGGAVFVPTDNQTVFNVDDVGEDGLSGV